MNLTVAQARPSIAKAMGYCASDTRVLDVLNRAVDRLLPKGKWVGTIARYRICTNSDCITWPRQIQTIEAIAIDGRPHKVRNGWFEFLESGQGVLNAQSNNGLQLVDRGETVAFDDITADEPNYIRIYTDLPETSKTIILQGYDENSNWIRTLDGSEYIEGLKVALPSSPGYTTTTQKFSVLVRVIKDATNGDVRLYENNGSTNIRALAIYEPDELTPSYRRSYVPGLRNVNSGNDDCAKASVEVVAKLRFTPVSKENDFIMLGNLPALEAQAKALRAFDNELPDKAYGFEAQAVQRLQEELDAFQGDGPVVQLRVERDVSCGTVENVISGGYIW